MNKILITGYSGFLGANVVNILKNKDNKVVGLGRTISELIDFEIITSDLCQIESVDFLKEYGLKGIIHLAANSNVNDCEQNPTESYIVNVKASVLLAEFASKHQIPFVFASSDQVFDGKKGNYQPTDKAEPVNEYGKQKRQAEIKILNANANAVICRLPLMVGKNGGYEKAFVENLKQGKTQTLFTDEIRSVEQVEIVAQKLIKALNFKGGIYHFGGPKAMNRYEIGMMLAKKNGLDVSLLKKGLQSEVKMLAARPSDVSLINNV